MLAAARLAGVVDPGPEDYVALGGHRRDEAVAALASLGVGERSVVFLGYPDQGTARILDGGHWGPGEPYRSRYTERDACPYPFVLTPGAPYCGQQIVSDVIRVIQGFWPDVILLPHPADTHDDHWATYAWWLYALERMDYVSATGAEVVCYMVHSGLDWPAPWGYQPDEQLRPPEGRAQPAMMWMRVDLEEEERVAKLRALEQHRSQMGLSGPFLKSFVRANELFCLVPGFDVVGDGADGGARPIAESRAVWGRRGFGAWPCAWFSSSVPAWRRDKVDGGEPSGRRLACHDGAGVEAERLHRLSAAGGAVLGAWQGGFHRRSVGVPTVLAGGAGEGCAAGGRGGFGGSGGSGGGRLAGRARMARGGGPSGACRVEGAARV